jgi:K+-sensing histidine kinase KdpD
MATLSFAETFSITALDSGITLVGTLTGAFFQSRISARQAEQAQHQFEQTQREDRLTLVYEPLTAQLDKARETQREALDNLQRQARDLSKLVVRPETAAEPKLMEAAADFKMWVSRIDDEDIRQAAFVYLDRCGEFETRLAEPSHNWTASAVPIIEAESELIKLTGHAIILLPLRYLPPGIEEIDHPDASAE